MTLLKKIDETSHIITWFEIPVIDLDRAIQFYETILDIKMTKRLDLDNESAFFPYDPTVIQATSGRVTGVLTKSAYNQPASNGTVIYINASPEIQSVLDKVEPAGGKIVTSQIPIPAGLIAIILDSEGNKIGLHAEK